MIGQQAVSSGRINIRHKGWLEVEIEAKFDGLGLIEVWFLI